MNDWTPKAGDNVRRREGTDSFTRVVDYVGARQIVYTKSRAGVSTEELAGLVIHFVVDFEPVPEVFEAGKTYRRVDNECVMHCLWADETVAILKNESGAKYLRSQDSRSDYEVIQ